MTEGQLQANIIRRFSNEFPECHFDLFAIKNEAKLGNQEAARNKALGVVAGVSDLFYSNDTRRVFIELKTVGSKFSAKHITAQNNFLKRKISQGFEGYFCTSEDDFFSIIYGNINDSVLTTSDVDLMLNKGLKTIIF